jgi:ubiquitin C-terminal hydrolase
MKLGIRNDSPTHKIAPSDTTIHGPVLTGVPPVGENELEFLMDNPTRRKLRDSVRSDVKTVGCFSFRILCFPLGNTSTLSANPKIAVYVECVNVENKDPRWVFNSVKFSICIINFKDVRKSLYQEDTHSFCAASIDRGWPDLLSHSDITQESGWLNDANQMCIRATVCVRQADTIPMNSDYNTRKETGFIGLSNLGSTCYLNGLLQSYFHLGKLCEIVYGIDTRAEGPSSPSGGTRMPLPLALQSVFLRMETSAEPVNCTDLIRAFGWDSVDAFTQHDVQELARILCDKLEERLKNTWQDGEIQKLFQGTLENFIECLDVDFKSTREEAFYDIPLNVRGLTNEPLKCLESSLKEFVATEILEKDNAYDAGEKFGKQRAQKGTRFKKLPPVLSFQLKRFSFDYEKLENVKLHDRFEFPTTLNMSGSEYVLHTVLVHSGDVNSGHYYAFVRPHADRDLWYRFDDEQVSLCSQYAAVDDNFGGEDVFPYNYCTNTKPPIRRQRIHSAYMLMYIRRDDLGRILVRPNVSEVRSRVEQESRKIDEKKKLIEEAKQVVNVIVHVPGHSLCDFDTSPSMFPVRSELKARQDMTIRELAQLVSETGVNESPANMALFYWNMSTGRIQLMPLSYTSGPSAIATPKNARITGDVSLYMESPVSDDTTVADRYLRDFVTSTSMDMDSVTKSEIHLLVVSGEKLSQWTTSLDSTRISLVLVKYYCPITSRLICLGVKPVTVYSTIGSLVPYVLEQLNQYLGESPQVDTATISSLSSSVDDWLAFEQIVSLDSAMDIRPIELVGGTFAGHATGSIIVFQKNTIVEAETDESEEEGEEQPNLVVRTVGEHAAMILSSVDVRVFQASADDPLLIDGILANGNFDDSSVVDVMKGSVVKEMRIDTRWTMKAFESKLLRDVRVKENQRLEVYEHYPSAMRDPPLVFSQDRKVGGGCMHLIPTKAKAAPWYTWNVWIVVVPRMSLSVRVFNDHVVEAGMCFIDVEKDFGKGGKNVRVADIIKVVNTKISAPACTYRLVEVCKSEIVKTYGPDEILNLEAAVVNTDNVLYDHIRLEPAGVGRECLVAHVDKQTGKKFGYPFVVEISGSVTAKQIRRMIQKKLDVTDKIMSTWRICSAVGHYLKDDDLVGDKVLIEHSRHPNPQAVNRSNKTDTMISHQKPLTIR